MFPNTCLSSIWFSNAVLLQLLILQLLLMQLRKFMLLLLLMLRLPRHVDAAAVAAEFADAGAAGVDFAAAVDVDSTDAQHPHR